MPLTTRCPHCGRLFPVYAQQIKTRRSKVECPQCGRRFAAISSLLEEQIPPSEIAYGRRKRSNRGRSASASPVLVAVATSGAPSRRATSRGWWIGVVVLTLGLISQTAWWERGAWMGRPAVWKALETVCDRLGCRIPLPRVAGSMEILSPTLTERPGAPKALRLGLALRNTTAVAQRLPLLQLELYDKDGELLAARRLPPDQYAAGKDARYGIAPGHAAQVELEMAPLDRPPSGFRVRLF
jgi:predicted Zn finger-like uncharacterized protein